MFPADRSWLVSSLWDDDWTCIGGPAELVNRFLRHPDLQARAGPLARTLPHQAIRLSNPDLQIRRFPCGRPGSFRAVRDWPLRP